ncbi:hypothetical protein TNIN_169111 [Trichonephila inaurata madagascariensis]|uniref:Uncharacterized protein n=1 Tax=Trichonephila inaurata madagascariensis TaxID=2747483 RepID=A0A8X7CCT0_9ARAC|nr:hypothetical protein TNIN_169111 [Trichonephila inaurata madagascariensis]
MIKNAFDFVANGFLFGPKTSKFQKEQESEMEFMLNDFRGEINEIIDNVMLKEVSDLNEFYKKLKDKFHDPKWTEGLDFQAKMQALHNILNYEPNKTEENSNEMNFPCEEPEDIGVRRAKLKAASFSQRALFRQLNPSDPEDEDEPDRLIICPSVPKRKRRRRLPKEERRKGRPPKAKNLEKELIESSGDETKSVAVQNVYIRKPGPISRTSYLDYYDDSTIMNAEHIQSVSPELSSTDED